MAEYSFEEVQRLWAKGDLPALFDMVWRAGEAEGEQNENERIIKLLESERWELPKGFAAGGETYLPLEQAIALIKGENK